MDARTCSWTLALVLLATACKPKTQETEAPPPSATEQKPSPDSAEQPAHPAHTEEPPQGASRSAEPVTLPDRVFNLD